MRALVTLAFQVSIICTVLAFGLKATRDDLLYLIRRPALFARSFMAVMLIMPIVAVLLVLAFDLPRTLEITLIALAISPVPPLLPKQVSGTSGSTFGLALLAWLALLSIATVPAALWVLELIVHRDLAFGPGAVGRVVLTGILVPLAAGVLLRRWFPSLASRLVGPAASVGKWLLPPAALVLLMGTLPAMRALVGDGTVVIMAAFVAAGLLVGHLLGGPTPEHSVVLALSSASRHPAIAFAVASGNFPDLRFGATIVLYLIVNAVVAGLYLKWVRGRLLQGASTS